MDSAGLHGDADIQDDNPLFVDLIEDVDSDPRHQECERNPRAGHSSEDEASVDGITPTDECSAAAGPGRRKRSFWKQRRQNYRDRQQELKREVKQRQRELREAEASGRDVPPESAEDAVARARVAAMLKRKARRQQWARLSIDEVPWGRPRLVLDLDWDYGALGMTHKELCSLVSQISFTYGALRRCDVALPLHIVGADSAAGVVLRSVQTSQYWKVFRSAHSFMHVFEAERDNLVYLTPDSPHVLDSISPDDIYILGGIADHNRLKGTTYTKANNLGIRTARLPIAEHLNFKIGNSLAINHVVSIICHYVTSSDWVSALEQAIPQRAGMRVTPGKESRFKLRKTASDTRHKLADAALDQPQQQEEEEDEHEVDVADNTGDNGCSTRTASINDKGINTPL